MSKSVTYSSPDYVSIPCNLDESKEECDTCNHAIFASYIIMVICSPVSVVGNALILAAIWKKTFQRTPFHILQSGLAFTDLCTGLIAQPLIAAPNILYLVNPRVCDTRAGIIKTISTVGFVSGIYVVAVTLLIMTLMSIERWLHMTRRSLVSSHRGFFTYIMLFLIPTPLVVFAILEFTKPERRKRVLRIAIVVLMLVCYLTTFVAYLRVFRIIRQHQQHVQGNEASQNFGQPAINLAKYKRSVVSILYILALFSFCFLPFLGTLTLIAQVGANPETSAVYLVSLAMLFLSPSLNPGLYLWRMSDIRIGVLQLLRTNG